MPADDKQKSPGRKPWWGDGLRFACQGSGKCCVSHGSDRYVYVTLEDRRRLAKTLGIPTRQFTRRYCVRHNGLFHLGTDEKSCVFLDERRCSVYEGRPTQCRTWPFWDGNLATPADWARAGVRCEGVNRGKLFPYDEIEARRKRTQE